uniref:Uncharacterized protein n=1 Tax=Oryza punctata TaxID=4537 RepID=A0A0E0MMP1_ORYPU
MARRRRSQTSTRSSMAIVPVVQAVVAVAKGKGKGKKNGKVKGSGKKDEKKDKDKKLKRKPSSTVRQMVAAVDSMEERVMEALAKLAVKVENIKSGGGQYSNPPCGFYGRTTIVISFAAVPVDFCTCNI